MKIAALLAACMLAAPAIAADQFDLMCSGTETMEGSISPLGAVTPAREMPFSEEFQIDLKARSYCMLSGCLEVRPIVDITADRLTLEDRPATDPAGSEAIHILRSSGLYSRETSGTTALPPTHTTAYCKAAPFKPFPPVKQMF